MKFVKNWKPIVLKSFSMWSIYLGIVVLVAPEALYLTTGRDFVSPYLTGYAGLALLVLGALGRIISQGIDDG